MKKYLLLIFIGALAACQSPAPKEQEQTTANKDNSTADKDLLTQAQGIFKPLPAVAENPANAVTPEKVKLGQLLYHDTRLSKTGNNSCNSCHNLETYGVDNKATSTGDAGKNGNRNSPTVLNAALHGTQFWDGRAKDVEEQAGGPILNPVEMAMPQKGAVVSRLKDVKEYREQFAAAFPESKDPVTYENLQQAIGAFERTLLTPSPFDKFLAGDASALNADQKHGLQTFMEAGCTACHNGVAVGGNMFQKFGVTADYRTFTQSKNNDEGRKALTKQDADKDFFKVPGLRNIEKTAPYFHDGSIAELSTAVKIMGKAQLNKDLTDDQVHSIVAFLTSLTGTVPVEARQIPKVLASR